MLSHTGFLYRTVFWKKEEENPLFDEDEELLRAWREHAQSEDNLQVRIGRWNIPVYPIAILVNFTPFFQIKNEIYTQAWEDYQVDSLHAYGDYDKPLCFHMPQVK